MTRATLLLLASSLFFAACGGTTASSSANGGDPADSNDERDGRNEPATDPSTWPQTTSKSTPWPWFGGASNGVVTAPEWQPPRALGCEVETTIAREPDREWLPGEGPREIVVRTGAQTCRPAGARLVAYEDAHLTAPATDAIGYHVIEGSCKAGFRLATRHGALAKITFASEDACTSYESMRSPNPAPTDGSFLATELSVVTLGAAAELRFVSAEVVTGKRRSVVDKE